MLTQTGHMNVDINDFARILSFGGESVLGVGKAETEEDAFDALEQALNNPLVSVENIDTAQGIIVHICCKKDDIKLSTYDGLVNNVRKKLKHDSALIVAGVSLEPELSTELSILIIASGISTRVLSDKVGQTELHEPYIGDDLSFISEPEHLEEFTNTSSFTDIPAIVRKLQGLSL
jgi:cell division protein FtsZ